jgi:hypothetical protein
MKNLILCALTFASVSAFAQDMSAVAKFTKFIPIGKYSGTSDLGLSCTVSVNLANYPYQDILVSVTEGNSVNTKLIAVNSEFGYKDYKREFVQTEQTALGNDDSNYVERIIRTVLADNNKQYIVISYSTVINNETVTESSNCLIDLQK